MTCPNCGHNSDYPRICPDCGHVRANPGSRVAAVIVAIVLVLPCAGIGACSLVVGVSANNPGSLIILMIAAICGIGCYGLAKWVKHLWRS